MPPSTDSRRICQPGQQSFFLSLPTTPGTAEWTEIPANFFERAAALCCLCKRYNRKRLSCPLHGSNCENPILATSFLHFFKFFCFVLSVRRFSKMPNENAKKQQTFFRFTASMCRCDGRGRYSVFMLGAIYQIGIS